MQTGLYCTSVRFCPSPLLLQVQEFENDSGSSQIFWLLKESELTPSSANILDGRYAVFGYIPRTNEDLLADLKVGDTIKSITITQGANNLQNASSQKTTGVPTCRWCAPGCNPGCALALGVPWVCPECALGVPWGCAGRPSPTVCPWSVSAVGDAVGEATLQAGAGMSWHELAATAVQHSTVQYSVSLLDRGGQIAGQGVGTPA